MTLTGAEFFHYFIYFNLGTGFLSALYMVFIVYQVKGRKGPLWKRSTDTTDSHFVRRRMFALEAWIIFGFLALYFAVTHLHGFSLQ